jgi:hypothetical protein
MIETAVQYFRCAHAGCDDAVSLHVRRHIQEVVADAIGPALELAAVYLGWRRIVATTITLCPKHAVGLLCSRCASEECSCVGGPRFDVQPGGDE